MSSSLTFRKSRSPALFLAETKMSQPSGKNPLWSLKTSRTNRLTLFLMTAPPTFLLTVSPSLVRANPFFAIETVKCAARCFCP